MLSAELVVRERAQCVPWCCCKRIKEQRSDLLVLACDCIGGGVVGEEDRRSRMAGWNCSAEAHLGAGVASVGRRVVLWM